MEHAGLRWTMAVPLAPTGGPLGALSLGVGRSGRCFGPADLPLAELLIGRAGLALANAQLVDRLRATQQRLDGILGALAEAVTVHDAAGRVEYANHAAAKLLGVPGVHAILTAEPGELTRRFDIPDEEGRPIADRDLPGSRVIRGENPEPLLTAERLPRDRPTALAADEGDAAGGRERRGAGGQRDRGRDRGARGAQRQRFLAEAGEAFASSLEYEETLRRVARARGAAHGRLVRGRAARRARRAPSGRARARRPGDASRRRRELRARIPAATGRADRQLRGDAHRRPMLIPEIPDELLVAAARDEEHLARIRALSIRSGMSVPMITAGRTLGVMTFVFSESARAYDEDDLAFAQELAARAAVAIENARLYTERSDVARTLQASLLPEELPDVPEWRFGSRYRPGERGADVGGDFYDVFPIDGSHVALLGDVTGKGVAAAALTSLVRHTAKTAAGFDARPSAVLTVVNRALRQRPQVAPVTMLCALLRDGSITFAVGGHPLPLLKRAGQPCERVGRTGLLLGAVDTYPGAEEVTVTLERGDTLLLYTDGVTDTPGDGGRFGEERLRAAVDAAPAEPDALLEAIERALDEFAVGGGLDDRAMLAVQRA